MRTSSEPVRPLITADMKLVLRASAVVLLAIAVLILEGGKSYFYPLNSVGEMLKDGSLSTKPLVSININLMLAFLLIVNSISYLIVSSTGFGWYVSTLKHELNLMRILQNSVTSLFMVAISLMLFGFGNVIMLSVSIAVSLAIVAFGYFNEVINQGRKKTLWQPFWMMLVFHFMAFGLLYIALNVGNSIVDSFSRSSVRILYAILAGHFSLLLALSFLRYKRVGMFRDYADSEKLFIIANLIGCSLFAVFVYSRFLI